MWDGGSSFAPMVRRSADGHLSIRATPGEVAGLHALVELHRGTVAGLGARVTSSGLMRALIRQACTAAGVAIADVPGPVSVDEERD